MTLPTGKVNFLKLDEEELVLLEKIFRKLQLLPENKLVVRLPKLSKAELDVTLKVFKGMTNQQIADSRFTHIKCVKWHLTNIYKKCKVKGRSELILKYVSLVTGETAV